DWNEWNRTNLLLLYGSITKKTMAGIMVTYASIPAMLSDKPPVVPVTAGATGPTERLHTGHTVAPAGI
ncbi:MAG: hypothetical protein JWO91_206, partial [Acidobacteriaceae bacterium]|nr:hypothetical protein [Acidobacteriaceae bacterium]